jgi:hypothetical protein
MCSIQRDEWKISVKYVLPSNFHSFQGAPPELSRS